MTGGFAHDFQGQEVAIVEKGIAEIKPASHGQKDKGEGDEPGEGETEGVGRGTWDVGRGVWGVGS